MDFLKTIPTTEEEIKQQIISYWREALKECTITKTQAEQLAISIKNVKLRLKAMEEANWISPDWKVGIDEETGEIIIECVPMVNMISVTFPIKKE